MNAAQLPLIEVIKQAPTQHISEVEIKPPPRIKQINDAIAALVEERRTYYRDPNERPQVTCPLDAYNQLKGLTEGLNQERMYVILVDTRGRAIDVRMVYQGTLNSSSLRVAEIFRDAIIQSANALVIAHNHPSGDTTPSPEDIASTRAIIQAGELLDIRVLDHLVIGADNFVSLKERGLAFK